MGHSQDHVVPEVREDIAALPPRVTQGDHLMITSPPPPQIPLGHSQDHLAPLVNEERLSAVPPRVTQEDHFMITSPPPPQIPMGHSHDHIPPLESGQPTTIPPPDDPFMITSPPPPHIPMGHSQDHIPPAPPPEDPFMITSPPPPQIPIGHSQDHVLPVPPPDDPFMITSPPPPQIPIGHSQDHIPPIPPPNDPFMITSPPPPHIPIGHSQDHIPPAPPPDDPFMITSPPPPTIALGHSHDHDPPGVEVFDMGTLNNSLPKTHTRTSSASHPTTSTTTNDPLVVKGNQPQLRSDFSTSVPVGVAVFDPMSSTIPEAEKKQATTTVESSVLHHGTAVYGDAQSSTSQRSHQEANEKVSTNTGTAVYDTATSSVTSESTSLPLLATTTSQERAGGLGGSGGTSPSSPLGIALKKKKEDFVHGEVIGDGSFGEVREVTDKVTRIKYAAKILRKKQIVKENKVKYVATEKTVMEKLRHPNIVRLFYTFQTTEELYYILELCPNGELLHLIKQAGALEEAAARFYGAELLLAIEYMHSKGIAHRDIKPENVLLDPSMHAKLSDFGTAKEIPLLQRSSSFVGTAEYVCPELLIQRSAGHPADMWSYGVMMFQMLTGSLPFKGVNEFQVFQSISTNAYELPNNLSANAKDLISKLLVAEPETRLTATTAKAHPFFAGIEWARLESTPPPPVTPRSPANTTKQESPPPSPPAVPEIIQLPVAHEAATQKKSPKLLRILRVEKRNSTPLSLPSNFATTNQTAPSPPKMMRTTSLAPTSSAPFAFFHSPSDSKLQPLIDESRQRSSSGFEAPPKFITEPSDQSRWANFLTPNERILYSGVVHLRKKMFFTRQKLFIFITDKRLALVEPTTFKVQHEYSWEGPRVEATLKEDTKTFTLVSDTKMRQFDEESGNTKQLVDLVQYLSAKGKI